MFSHLFSLLPIVALAAVATAVPNPPDAHPATVPNTPDANPATVPKTSSAHPACGGGAAYCCDQKFYVRYLFSPSIFLGDSRIHSQDHTDFTGNLGAHLAAAVGATVITCDSITGGTCSVQTACCFNNNVVSLHHVSLHSPLRTDGVPLFFFLFHAEWCWQRCLRPRCCQRVKLISNSVNIVAFSTRENDPVTLSFDKF